MNRIRIHNGSIFTGEEWFEAISLTIDNGKIHSVSHTEHAQTELDLQGGQLLPAFIDLQLYGGNGQLFGEHPSVEALEATVAYSRAGGAALIVPTVATNSNQVLFRAVDAVRGYWKKGGVGVAGLHLEGPFINPAKKGAHAEEYIQQPTTEALESILDYGKDVIRMMTIAPEQFDEKGLALLQQAGIILSAGHSNASYEEAANSFGKGIRLATHLYNAMSPLQHRAPGMVGAIFDHPSLMSSIVADGYHVDEAAIRIAKKIMGERLFLITDAVTENNSGHYRHVLNGSRYCMPDGTLSGSALTMYSAIKFCIEKVGIDAREAIRMASLYPARALGIAEYWGRIASGYTSEFCYLDVDGRCRLIAL